MAAFLFSNPQAPERNPPIVPEFYSPSVFYISQVALGSTTTVTTEGTNNYVIGNSVRFHIPNIYMTTQLNDKTGIVIQINSSTQFVVSIDSSQYDTFNSSPVNPPTKPQVCAIGDYNSGSINSYGIVAQGTSIPGSFVNTSPIEGPWLN